MMVDATGSDKSGGTSYVSNGDGGMTVSLASGGDGEMKSLSLPGAA